MKTNACSRVLQFVALSILLAGCTVHRKIHISYQPAASSPLTALKPMKFALVVEDSCPADEKDQLAHINKVIFVVDGGSVAAVAAAFKAEIERAGHQVIVGVGAGTDAVVKVDLKRMRTAMRQRGGTELVKTVLLEADISVWRTGQESRATRFKVTEAQEKVYTLAATGAVEEMVNQAFQNFVRNSILDPRFVEPLR